MRRTAPQPEQPMTTQQRSALVATLSQCNASFALEGFKPTAMRHFIDAAIIDGRVTITQARIELEAYVEANRTVAGFVESRHWNDKPV